MQIQVSKSIDELDNLFSEIPDDKFITVNRKKPRKRTGGCGRLKHWQDRCIYPRGGGWRVRIRFEGKLYNVGWSESRGEAKQMRNGFWREKYGDNWQAIIERKIQKANTSATTCDVI